MEQPQQYESNPQPPPPPQSETPQLQTPTGAPSYAAVSSLRPRGRTACQLCSKRKIKCDAYERSALGQACSNCAKRGQSELCSFNDSSPRSGSRRSRPSEGGESSPGAPRPKKPRTSLSGRPPSILDGIHSASATYSQPPPPTNGHGHVPTGSWGNQNGTEGYGAPAQKSYNVVPNPVPNAQATSGPPRHAQYYESPLAAQSARGLSISELLPPHKSVLRFFDVYKAICHPIHPVITDLEDFEAAVCQYVEDSNSGRLGFDLGGLTGRALAARQSWLALLTATLATGVQYSDLHTADRDSMVASYTRNTMELLRRADYMGRPDENCIGAILLLARITENDLMPEASWTSLGMVGRMAELAGIHKGMSFDGDTDVRTREVIHLRYRRLWWSYIWQESGLALCFGKGYIITHKVQNDPPISTTANLTYNDCMLLLCRLALQARSDESVEKSNLNAEVDALASARHLHERALPRLADRQNCRTIQDRIEYYSLRISQGFIVSCMSQTLMKASSRLGWEQQRRHLESMCREGALDCLQAFVDMQSFSVVPLRTWIFIFSALSSALVLAALDADSAKTQDLQRQLLSSLAERDREQELAHRPGWYASYPKAMSLLRRVSETSHTNGRPREEQEGGDASRLPEGVVKELLDPAKLWENYFSASVAGEAYPVQQVVMGT